MPAIIPPYKLPTLTKDDKRPEEYEVWFMYTDFRKVIQIVRVDQVLPDHKYVVENLAPVKKQVLKERIRTWNFVRELNDEEFEQRYLMAKLDPEVLEERLLKTLEGGNP